MGAAASSSSSVTATGRSPCSARPNVCKHHRLYPINGSASIDRITPARICSGAIASPKHDVGNFESDGIPIATGSQSETPKKLPETDAIFDNIKAIGEYSRGGQTQGDAKASDHDMGSQEKYIPCGLVDENSGQLHIHFGSSFKTSDFIVDTIEGWWESLSPRQKKQTQLLQLKVDNGPESSGVRTQFLKRMVRFLTKLASPFNCSTTRPIAANTIPLNVVGTFLLGIF
jgi:Rhodopirellula transposase DDE domain